MSDFKINDYNALTDEILNNENFVRFTISIYISIAKILMSYTYLFMKECFQKFLELGGIA